MERSKVALFIDVENLTHWIKHGGPEMLISELAATGQMIVRRAYGNWGNSSIQNFQADLNRLGFELIHNFHPISKKNSSDIQLTIDVIEYALRLQDVQWFVLATGDSDFSPLFRRLREMGKDVVGVGPKSPLSESVKTSCSRYIYTNLEKADNSKDIRSAIDDAMDITESILQSTEGPQPLSTIKGKILNIDSAFNEKTLGFQSFTEFLRSNETILLTQDGKNNSWTCQLKTTYLGEPIPAELKNEPLEKQYERLLRQKKWRSVSSQVLNATYHALKNNDYTTKEKITQEILNEPQNTTTQTDINKALAIFMKAGLIKLISTEEHNNSEKTIHLDKSKNTYIPDIDLALLSRLITSAQEHDIPIEKHSFRDLLYGKYDNNTLDNMIRQAQTTDIAFK